MGAVIGGTLPLALGIAISPIPIIAAILMLLSPKARVTSIGFLLGWVLGIVTSVTVFTVVSSVLPEADADTARPVQGAIQIVLGLLLLALAVKQWLGRPKQGEEPIRPAWMHAIDTMGFLATFGLGFVLSALNPKNLVIGAGAGVDIGSADLSIGAAAIAILVFTLIAASTVAIPVVGYLVATDKIRNMLDRLRTWLEAENAVIMAILLLVIGVSMVGKGIAQF